MRRPSDDGHGFDIGAFEGCGTDTADALRCGLHFFEEGTPTETLTVVNSLPIGGSISMVPGSYTVAQNQVFIVTATPAPGYCFTGWSGTVLSPASLTTAVVAASQSVAANFAQCDFSIGGAALTAPLDTSAASPVTVTSLGIFSQPVSLVVSGQTAGMTASVLPATATSPLGGVAQSTVTVGIGPSVTPGVFQLTLTGTSGTLIHSASVSVTVPASASGTAAVIGALQADGCIDSQGVATVLTSKLAAAQSYLDAGDVTDAIDTLTALLNQLQALGGKHIATTCVDAGTTTPFDATQTLIADVEALLATPTTSSPAMN